jgi:hypothetical protein
VSATLEWSLVAALLVLLGFFIAMVGRLSLPPITERGEDDPA